MKTRNDELPDRQMGGWELLAKYFRLPQVLLSTVALATAVLYSGTLFFQFVWDDAAQIVDNPLIRSWHSLSRVFGSDLWYHSIRRQIYYRPLFVAWSILNYAVVGLRPWGWHLGAVLLHIGATLAVFWLVRRLGLEYWTAALATVIFAFHPIHIECVAWISAASDSMVTIFAAMAFVAFLNARNPGNSRKRAWQVASLGVFFCALLTKEMAVSLVGLVGIYAWLFPNRNENRPLWILRQALIETLPYAAVTLCYVILRRLSIAHSWVNSDVQHGFGDAVLTVPYVLLVYLKQIVVPIGLTGLYYTPYVTTQIVRQFVFPIAILAVVAGLIYWWARRTGDWVVAFAGCWLLVGLTPVLYLRSFGNGDFVRDRYMYLPSIGFAILVAKGLRLLPRVRSWSSAAVQGSAAAVLCLAYIGMSLPQQAYWDSDLLVYARGHELYPENPYASVGLGHEYSRLGLNDRAIALLQDAFKRTPTDTAAVFGLAEVYVVAGRKDEGRQALEYALRVRPEYLQSEVGAATIAGLWGQLKEYDRASAVCSRILAQDPNLYSALYNCGNLEQMSGHYPAAEQLLRRAIEVSPQLADPRYFLGRALLLDGKNAEARPYLSQAVAMDPSVFDYHYWLGLSLQLDGDKDDARREYLLALQLNEDSPETKLRLADLEGK